MDMKSGEEFCLFALNSLLKIHLVRLERVERFSVCLPWSWPWLDQHHIVPWEVFYAEGPEHHKVAWEIRGTQHSKYHCIWGSLTLNCQNDNPGAPDFLNITWKIPPNQLCALELCMSPESHVSIWNKPKSWSSSLGLCCLSFHFLQIPPCLQTPPPQAAGLHHISSQPQWTCLCGD